MLKKIIAFIMIISIVLTPLFSEAELSYEPYGEDEFPIWTMKLRRAESLFFGSLVLTFPIAMLTWNILEHQDIVHTSQPIQAFGWQMLIAGSHSLTIATADWIIGEVSE